MSKMMDQRLSLVAQYDDLIRYCESFIGGDLIEEKVKSLLESCDKQRVLCLVQRNELIETKEQMKKLRKENLCLETTLKNVRAAFKCEVNLKEKFKQERNALINKLTLIQNFLLEDVKENQSDMKEKILGSLNMSKLQPVAEQTLTDDSFSDIEFDKTDDDLLGGEQMHSTRNRISTSGLNKSISKDAEKHAENERRLSREFEKEIEIEREKKAFRKRKSLNFNNPTSPKKGKSIGISMIVIYSIPLPQSHSST